MRGFGFQRWMRRSGLCALLVCLLALSGCQFPGQSTTKTITLPTLPKGWSWYHDSVYPFDLPVPAGWKAFGYWGEYYSGDHCARQVDLIPSQWLNSYPADAERIPQSIKLTVPTTCPDFVPARDNKHLQPAGTTLFGSQSASLYTQVDEVGDFRAAIAHFGGRQYVLYFNNQYGAQSNSSSDASQLAIFDAVRENFTYHG